MDKQTEQLDVITHTTHSFSQTGTHTYTHTHTCTNTRNTARKISCGTRRQRCACSPFQLAPQLVITDSEQWKKEKKREKKKDQQITEVCLCFLRVGDRGGGGDGDDGGGGGFGHSQHLFSH